jgi:outer membrane protein TolC
MMFRFLPVALLLISFAGYSQKQMTLQACITYALENNPTILSSKESVKSSEAKVGEYMSAGFPQVSASADLGNNYEIPTTFVPAQIFDPSAPEGALAPVQFGTKYTGRASVDLSQMIFSGSYFVGLKAAKTYTELARRDLIKTEIDLLANIKKSYYGVLVLQERHALVMKNYQRLDSLLRETRAMYESGFAEKIDVNRVQVQYNNIAQSIKTSATALDVAMQILKFNMGMKVSEQLVLTDNLETIKRDILAEDVKASFNYNNRIEYSILEVNQALAELDIKNTKVQYLPYIDFYANYGASYGTSVFSNFVAFGDNWRTLGAFGLRFSIPIFDGLMKSKQIQQKRAQLTKIELAKVLTKSQIDLEQSQSAMQLTNSVDILNAQQVNMKLAEEVYQVTLIKYQQGVGSNLEVIDADAGYKEAQTNYFSALYDALIAAVDLEKAYGKLSVTN